MDKTVDHNQFSQRKIRHELIQFMTDDSRRSHQVCLLLLIVLVTSVALILVDMGAVHIATKPWDVVILLDGGWRIINGQTPHEDFYSPLGPLSLLLTAFGMKVAAPSASAIAYGNALLLLFLPIWAWVISRNRLSAINAFVFALFLAFLLIAPRALGDGITMTSYAMLYNRQGYVLLSMLFVELFIPLPDNARPPTLLISGLSSGVLLALLLFCKINYFGMGIIAVLAGLIAFRYRLTQLVALVFGFFVICIFMQLWFDINGWSMMADINFASNVQAVRGRLISLFRILRRTLPQTLLFLVALFITWVLTYQLRKKAHSIIASRRGLMIALFVALSGIILCATNAQRAEIPLFFLASLLLLEYVRRMMSSSHRIGLRSDRLELNYLFLALIVLPLFFGNIFLKDLGGFSYSVIWHKSQLPTVPERRRFESNTLYDLVIPENAHNPPSNDHIQVASEYTQVVNDGLALLREHVSERSRIFSMGFSNPFPFALELPPPHGDALWWHRQRTFDEKYFPDPEKNFGNVDLVIVPNFTDPKLLQQSEAAGLMQEVYGEYLASNFVETDASRYWTLLARKPTL